ncbi:MAG: O-methyltransferase [Bacteroidetes bacterium]|nr:O-methyltransferase [Bacteroidota bacterium]
MLNSNFKDIFKYSEKYTTKESEFLCKLRLKTELEFTNSHMISGMYQGRILSFISCLIKPKKILEIGTFTGYSAICLSEGLTKDGILYTIDNNISLKSFLENIFKDVKLKNKIKFLLGNAIEIVPKLENDFDLAFIDANKKSYCKYYDLIIDKIKKGGVIIADNVLWKGKVLEENIDNDKLTKSMIEFNKKIFSDDRTEKILLPIRDGLYLIRKLY